MNTSSPRSTATRSRGIPNCRARQATGWGSWSPTPMPAVAVRRRAPPKLGTMADRLAFDVISALPTRDFSAALFDAAEALRASVLHPQIVMGRLAGADAGG